MSIVVLAALIVVGSAVTLLAQTPILRDALQTDADGNSKTNAGDRLRYTLTFTNTSGATLTNVQINIPGITNTTLDGAATTATPIARDEGPVATSTPGNPFHTAFNTALTVNDGDPDEDLLNNDFPGVVAATITKFGGGTLSGAVDDNNAGGTANSGGHSLTVNANGSFTYTPANGFAGLFLFQYRLANAQGSDTATVTIAVGERPSAVADARGVTGNVQIDTATGAAFSVLDNDDGDAVTINLNTAGTLGAVVMSANGQFIYTPPRGKSSGTDAFTYTLQNGFGTSTPATVTLNFDGNIVWFIDGSGGAGDGRSHTPYNTLAAFNAVNDGGANNPGDNHVILLRDGTYANNVAGGALVLRNEQRVIGDGWSGTFLAAAGFSLAAHNLVAAFTGTDPLIQNSTGHGVALLSGNHLRGLTVGNTPNGFGYSGTAVGSPTIAECSKTGTGGAINVGTSGTFGSSVSFDTLESSSSIGHNLSLTNVTGTLGVASGGSGLAGSAGGSAAVSVSGGSVSLAYSGTVSKANAGSLVNVSGGHTTGTLTFNGAMNATAGDGLQFNNADGIYNFNAAVTLNGGDAAIDIINGSDGNFSFSDTDITNPSGAAFLVNTSAGGSIGHGGTITKNNAGRAVDIQGKTGGSVTFNGTISQNNAASTGIFLNGNTGGTFGFLGAITLTTSANAAFTATGGGTVTATASGSTLATTTGTALNVANTTIGASGLTFQSISANGAFNGIVLNNTGANGGLTVTGDGSGAVNGSGGLIQNTTGTGIKLTSTRASFTQLNINTTGTGVPGVAGAEGHGIDSSQMTAFTFQDATLINVGSGNEEQGMRLTDMLGTSLIEDVTMDDIAEDGIQVRHSSGTAGNLTFRRLHVQDHKPGFGESGMEIQTDLGSTVTILVDESDFTLNNNAVIGVAMSTAASHTGNLTVTVTNSTFFCTNSFGMGSVQALGGGSGTARYNVFSNRVFHTKFDGIRINNDGTQTTFASVIGNTVIGSGAGNNGEGITMRQDENGALTALISGNFVTNFNANGIRLQSQDNTIEDGPAELNATVINNRAYVRSSASGGFGAGFYLDIGDGAGVSRNDVWINVSGNTLVGTETAQFFDFDITLQLNEVANASLRITQTSEANLSSVNNGASTTTFANPPNTITYSAGAPPLP